MTPDPLTASPGYGSRPTFPTLNDSTNDVEQLRQIALTGDTRAKIPNLSRIIRLFISSTFKDMTQERDKIIRDVYPRLEKYCASKGYILQIVDMRWGIFESAANNQLTTDICLDEIRLAKELSNGPFFIAILSHRYGSKFAPRSILKTEFDLLLQQCDQRAYDLLTRWYEIDKNNVPMVYNLKTLEDDVLKAQWETSDSELVVHTLRDCAYATRLSEEDLIKYTRSVTEIEIHEGIFKTEYASFRCVAFFREINVLNQLITGTLDPMLLPILSKYVDINPKTSEIDSECQQRIIDLKETIQRKLSQRKVQLLRVNINSLPEFMQSTLVENEFESYIKEFTERFDQCVTNLIEANINRNEILFHVLENYADLFHHLRFCHEKVKGFMGRHSIIEQIRSLLLEQHVQYIIMYGISGSGKTSLMAKIAENLQDWLPDFNFVLVLRFIGTSEDSYNIQNMLSSIIKQLAHCFDLIINYEEMTPIDKLYNYFKKFLIEVSQECSENQQIYILLDSLDQLSPAYGSRKLDWFPIGLPKNIHMIVSTLADTEYESFQAIQNLVKNTSNNYVQVTELANDEIRSAIQYRLDNTQRILTETQMEYLLKLFEKCSIPLYIKLVMDQAIHWKHSTSMTTMIVSEAIKPAIHDLLEKIELSYGIVLVKKVLQYMTLSRHGLYENYFQNILANDETVVAYIKDQFRNHEITCSRLPQIFLIRLMNALKEYLSGPMYRWYHRAFWEVAADRYCQDDISNQNCHRTIVQTYQQEKFNKSNPFWMNELPYHATCANNLDVLKNNFLLNLKFMQMKAQGSDIDQLITDYEFAIFKHNQDYTLKLVHQVLLIAAYKIRQDPLQLPGQLFGRLYGYEAGNDLSHLLEQCLSPLEDAIVSSRRFMAGPNNLLSKSLIVHKTEIKSIVISNDNKKIVSVSVDNCIKVLDGKTFEEIMTIFKKYDSTSTLTISDDGSIIYAWCRIREEKHKNHPLLEAFSLHTGEPLFEINTTMLQNHKNKHCEVIFSELYNELWLITKDHWYHLDWQNGTVTNVFNMPQELARRSDKIICLDKVKDRIVVGLDVESLIVSINKSGDYSVRDLFNQTVMGRRFLILSNQTLAISTRRIFKSLYDDKDMEWNILLCHLESLVIERKIPVNKALRMWRSSLDSTRLFCNAFNYIYVLNIEKRQTEFILEHSSQMNSCTLLNDSTVISATWDNKLHIWELSGATSLNKTNISENVNLFDPFNSRMIRFLYDDFNTLSRYVFVYNVFDEHSNELFILYDLSTQKCVRTCKIEKHGRNDLQPLSFINRQYVLLFCSSEKVYYFLNVDQFTIVKEYSCATSRVFQRIDQNHAIVSIRHDRTQQDSLVLFDCTLLCFETMIQTWNNIEWCTVNARTIIYKKNSDPIVYLFKISSRDLIILPLDMTNSPARQVISSIDGQHLIIVLEVDITTSSIKIYKIETVQNREQSTLCFEKSNLKHLGLIKFVGNQYVVYQHKEGSDRLTICHDLFTNTSHLWFQDDDSQGLFDCLKHDRSKYIWYQRYQVSRMNKVKTDISIFHIQDVSNPICSLDVDCRLRINQVALFDNGNAMLVKILDKLEFVAFFLKSKTKIKEENTMQFDNYILNDSANRLTLKRSTFYQICRRFSFIQYAE